MMRFPAIFVSHGPPNLLLHDGATRRFLSGLGTQLGTPRGIVAISAHWEARTPTVNASAAPKTIHDFFGFEPELYEMSYPARGATQLAEDAARRLEAAGMRVARDTARGLDHGVWAPLKLMYPDASVPVTQISVQRFEAPQHHYLIGQSLRELREDGVLILGSGNATHNLRAMLPEGSEPPDWVQAFAGWLRQQIASGEAGELLGYRDTAPFAEKNHPTEEHFLPLFVPLGAGTPGTPGRLIHSSYMNGVLAMDAFAFD